MIKLNAASIASQLDAVGFTTSKISEPSREEDGSISISPDVHVSVQMCGYLCTVREEGGLFHFGPDRAFVAQIIDDLRDITEPKA